MNEKINSALNYKDFVDEQATKPTSILDKITTTGSGNYVYDYNIHGCTLTEVIAAIEKLRQIKNAMNNGITEYDAQLDELIKVKIHKLINKI